MLKKYNQYIKESSNYRYPYSRIMILINSVDDYYKVLKFVEDNFNVEINLIRNNEYFRNPDINLNHILLSVPVLYLIIRKEIDKIDDVDILRFYSTEISNINELLEIINDDVASYYFNEKDILSIDDLNVVISLLKTGKKDTYNYLYNKEKINVYESLLDKLKGPSKEEIKNKFLNGEIDIVKYNEYCKENNLKEPSSEELLSILSKQNPEKILYTSIKIDFFDGIKYVLNDKKVKIYLLGFSLFKKLLKILDNYNEKDLLFDVMNKYFTYSNSQHKEDLESYYLLSCMYGYIDGIIDALSNRGVEVDARSYLAIEIAIKYNRLDVVMFLLNYTKDTDIYNNFISVAKEYLITHNINNKEIKNYLYKLK